MPRSMTRYIRRDVEDAASEIKHVLRKAAPRLRDDGQEAVAEGARRLRIAARDMAVQARQRSRGIAADALRQARTRPLALGAIVAAAAAVIGLVAFARRPAGQA